MKKFKTALIQALFTFVMLVILLPVTVHAREINGVNLMLTPPAIGKTLDFNVIVGDESSYIIESGFDVTWYKDWGASGYQKCDVYHTVEAGVPFIWATYGFGTPDGYVAKIDSFSDLLNL